MPVDALTRYSVRDGENGPPWGPKKAMPAEGVTINEGEDCPVGLCAALVCANNKIAGRVNKPIDAIWPVVIIAHLRRREVDWVSVKIGARNFRTVRSCGCRRRRIFCAIFSADLEVGGTLRDH